MKIILASASLGRKKILTDLGLKFTVMPAKIDERKITASSPILLVKKIAKAKAVEVSKKLIPHLASNNFLVIAADSMVFFQNKLYGKPKSKTEAKTMLSMLSGQTHELLTGLCVLKDTPDYNLTPNRFRITLYQRSCRTKVIFEKLTPEEINEYVRIAPVTSCAGGYFIAQTHAAILNPAGLSLLENKIKLIGSQSNVIGLPFEKLLPILKMYKIPYDRKQKSTFLRLGF